MSLTHNVFAFLWALFLECGPNIPLLRYRLSSISAFCTDWGTESAICDVVDMLPEFMATLGFTEPVPKMRWLFPNAFWVPGWHRLIDSVSKDATERLSFYPDWLTKVRALVKFLRIDAYRQVVADRAEALGWERKPGSAL